MFVERTECGVQVKKKELAVGLAVVGLVYGGARFVYMRANPGEKFEGNLLHLIEGVGGLAGCTAELVAQAISDAIIESREWRCLGDNLGKSKDYFIEGLAVLTSKA